MFGGAGPSGRFRAALISKQNSLLIDIEPEDASSRWSALTPVWRKRRVDTVRLDDPGMPAGSGGNGHWHWTHTAGERRSGLPGLSIRSSDLTLGLGSALEWEPENATDRLAILDASWTHIASFPDRDEVRSAFEGALRSKQRRVFYITNVPWDRDLFDEVSSDVGRNGQAESIVVEPNVERLAWQVRELAPRVRPDDMVLLGLVPRRDDRGIHQRLRSDFAERTEHVRAYPLFPLSSGPGPSREEALESVALWLPTEVLIGSGPLSEQVLLARHISAQPGMPPARVAVAAGEYRISPLELVKQHEQPRERPLRPSLRLQAARSGLVVATYGRDDAVRLTGTGLAGGSEAVVAKLRISRYGKSPERVVHEVENAFSSRGLPVPAVRFLP